jgi:putative copper export protein
VGLIIVAFARLYTQSYAIHGASDAMNAGMMHSMVRDTTWGTAWFVQLIAALIGALAFAVASRARTRTGTVTAASTIATVCVLVLAFTPAFSGQAAASPQFTGLAIASDGLHVLGAGGWLGTLLVILAVGLPLVLSAEDPDRGGMVADLINGFSPAALTFASVVVLTGIIAAWLHLGRFSALWSSSYGRALLIKLAVLVPLIGTGAYNWRRVRPVLGDSVAASRLRRSATVELIIGTLVILITAVLVALPTPVD